MTGVHKLNGRLCISTIYEHQSNHFSRKWKQFFLESGLVEVCGVKLFWNSKILLLSPTMAIIKSSKTNGDKLIILAMARPPLILGFGHHHLHKKKPLHSQYMRLIAPVGDNFVRPRYLASLFIQIIIVSPNLAILLHWYVCIFKWFHLTCLLHFYLSSL